MLSSSRSLLKCHLITMPSLTTLSHSSTHKCTSTHARAHVYTISSLLALPDILYICLFAYDSSFPTKVWVPWDQGLWFVPCCFPSTWHSLWHKLGTQHIWYCERCNKPGRLAYKISNLSFTQTLCDLCWLWKCKRCAITCLIRKKVLFFTIIISLQKLPVNSHFFIHWGNIS